MIHKPMNHDKPNGKFVFKIKTFELNLTIAKAVLYRVLNSRGAI